MSISPLHEYQELCSDCRNREAHAWVIPTAAFTWTLLAVQALANIKLRLGVGLPVFAAVNVLVFASLFILFGRWSLYQLAAQRALKELLKKPEFASFLDTPQYMDLTPKMFEKDGAIVRFLAKQSSTKFMYFVMSCILVTDLAVLIWAIADVF
jgi:hypothetical protein